MIPRAVMEQESSSTWPPEQEPSTPKNPAFNEGLHDTASAGSDVLTITLLCIPSKSVQVLRSEPRQEAQILEDVR